MLSNPPPMFGMPGMPGPAGSSAGSGEAAAAGAAPPSAAAFGLNIELTKLDIL